MIVAEAAEELGVTVARVRHLIAAGRLQAEKRGRDWWIEAADLEAVRVRKVGRPVGYRKSAPTGA